MKRAPAFHHQRNYLFILYIALLLLSASFKAEAQVENNEQPPPNAYYMSWLNEDVIWIISDQERAAFNKLQNDDERDRFIDAFWARRNPRPDQLGNSFEDEHYRRIQYANEHFEETDLPGWQTERGRSYIKYGPPDEISSFPAGTAGPLPLDKELHTAFPKEIWKYRWAEGLGINVKMGFVDTCMCGDYRIVNKPQNPPVDTNNPSTPDKQVLIAVETLDSPPQTKYKNLEEILAHQVNYSPRYFPLSLEITKTYSTVTDATSLTTIEIKVSQSNLQPSEEETIPVKKLIVFGRITSIGGRIVKQFDDSINIHDESPTDTNVQAPTLKEIFPLRPGKYRLSIAVQDVSSKKVGTWDSAMIVPE